jgi:hypothetical protein
MAFSEKVAEVAEVAEKLFFSFQSSVLANLRSKNNLRPVAPRATTSRHCFQPFTNFWNLIGGHSHTRLPPVFFDSPRRSLSAAPHSRALLLVGLS